MNFSDFKNSKNLLSNEQMKNVKGGELFNCNHGVGCTATSGGVSHSYDSCNSDLMLAWGNAWAAAGYTVRCYNVYAA
jgi:hypothetical protein